MALGAVTALCMVSGCGGGSTPSAPTSARKILATIAWPERTRGINASMAALSAQIVIPGGAPDGTNVIWTVNRPNSAAAAEIQYESPQYVKFGTYNTEIHFYTQASGAGDDIASAKITLQNDSAGVVNVGTITLSRRIQSVEIVPGQNIAVGAETPVQVVPRDASGAVVAISEGSAKIEIVEGGDKATVVAGRLRGLGAGVAKLKATIDSTSSSVTPVGVGNVAFTLGVQGTRGTVPATIQGTERINVSPSTPQPVATGFASSNLITVPPTYGDRSFLKWVRNGSEDVATTPQLTNLPGNLRPGDTLTAVYTPVTPPSSGLIPSYNKSDNASWPTLPLTVGFAANVPQSARPALIVGLNRWVSATGGVVSYSVVESNPQVLIEVGETGGAAGLTTVTGSMVSGHLRLTQARIDLLGAVVGNVVTPSQQDQVAAVIAHEFGHALGIVSTSDQGHSTDPSDVMFGTVSENSRQITQRDLNTLYNLYPSTFSGRAVAAPIPADAPRITRVIP